MKQCAYCDKIDQKITKEHVVNKSFLDRFHKAGKGYANVYGKYTQNYLTVKDVCDKCNNEILSTLDNYFLSFYEQNIPTKIIDIDSEIIINYQFDKLSKWLLKTLYNSERRNAYEGLPQKMKRYKQYILGRDKRTKLFKIYLELLKDVSVEKVRKYADENRIDMPLKLNFLRIGNIIFSDQLKSEITNTIKHITSSNFMFHIFILDPGQHTHNNFELLISQYFKTSKTNKIIYLDPSKESIIIRASDRTIIDILETTFEGEKHVVERMTESI